MAFDDFVAELARRQNTSVERLKRKQDSYLLNTNVRGRKLLHLLAQNDVSVAGKNVLDIGCAYGGFSVEAAKQGANVIGVDHNPRLLSLAKLNSKNDAVAAFHECDANSPALPFYIEAGWADIIILGGVLESIADPIPLLKNLRHVSTPDSLIYFSTPNGRSTKFVKADGHQKIFGLSIIPTSDWRILSKKRQTVFYRRWEYYCAIFEYFGWSMAIDLTQNQIDLPVKSQLEKDLETLLKTLNNSVFESDEARNIVFSSVEDYRSGLMQDIDLLDEKELERQYLAPFRRAIFHSSD